MSHCFTGQTKQSNKFMWHLTENIDGGAVDASRIEFHEVNFKF